MRKIMVGVLICGWFLMSPPGGNYNLPLKEWIHTGSFDSAIQCENAAASRFIKAEQVAKNQPDDKLARRSLTTSIQARCVPSDHIKPH